MLDKSSLESLSELPDFDLERAKHEWESLYPEFDYLNQYNRRCGYYFFTPSTMRFFEGRICNIVQTKNAFLFISSSAWSGHVNRIYKVCAMTRKGEILDLSDQFDTLSKAKTSLKNILKDNIELLNAPLEWTKSC